MTNITAYIRYTILYIIVTLFLACQQPGGNVTGSEYMPDMAHSVAYEANYYNYYYFNTWGSEDEYYKMSQPREPVTGTIARGYAGGSHMTDNSAISGHPNGSVPYYYGNTEEERTRAMAEIVSNPYQITDNGLIRGKELYDIFCGICHGDKGDGIGYLVREDGGVYPVQPANMLLPEFVTSSNGRYYHAIMFGKNKMGAYQDKLSFEERWQVIHYIRFLQAKELKLEYSQVTNTLNDIDVPAGIVVVEEEHEEGHDSGSHESDDHGGEQEDGEHNSDDHGSDGHH